MVKLNLQVIPSFEHQLSFEAEYVMYIIDDNNQLFFKKQINYDFDWRYHYNKSDICSVKELSDNKDRLLANNILTVGFDITVYREINCRENSVPKPNRFGRKSEDITKDCRLVVGKEDQKEFFVSKLFLSSKSDVFDRMFTTDFIEKKNNEVIIDDIDSDVFEQFLQYLYTGNCDKLYEMLDELLYVADKYMVSSLKTICLNLIFLKINGKNAFQTIRQLKDFGADSELMIMANKWIGENIPSVVNQEILKHYTIDSDDLWLILHYLGNQLSPRQSHLLYYTYSYNN
ncbi:speckle-type POZ protein-like [Oppia nitens]|nr:speckle-type POZ protein-like [Oppia nitens]